jgi:hypothetical protein
LTAEQDRRSAARLDLKVPVKLRPLEGATPYVFSGKSLNLSERGLFVTMDNPPQVGATIELSFTMPRDLTGSAPMKVRCTARVIRVETKGVSEGKVGIAAHIERFETIVAET